MQAYPEVMVNAQSDSPALLEVRGLEKQFAQGRGLFRATRRVQAVAGVSFGIASGETLGLVGESGSGKTTIGKLIVKLIEPTSGSIRLQGREINSLNSTEMRPMRRVVQIIFQTVFIAKSSYDGGRAGRGTAYHTPHREPQSGSRTCCGSVP